MIGAVNTKADVRFNVGASAFLPAWVKQNLMEQEKNRMNSDGELVLTSQRHRTQKCGIQQQAPPPPTADF